MRSGHVLFCLAAIPVLLGLGGIGCGKEIGDTCQLATDCDPDGSRLCDLSAPDGQGYCTIMGCDYNTCPSEAECVQFLFGEISNEPCDPATEGLAGSAGTHDCDPDEVCDLAGFCAPASSEVRYCMRICHSDGDCRTPDYECRTFALEQQHGGEVVMPPGQVDNPSVPGYCAPVRGSGA